VERPARVTGPLLPKGEVNFGNSGFRAGRCRRRSSKLVAGAAARTICVQSIKEFFEMTKTIRSQVVLALAMSVAGTVCFAQSGGEATYKAKCQSCHGATGTPSPAMTKMMGVKPVSDPDIQKLTADQMIASVTNGKGKMQPFKGKLTDAEIKDVITFYKGMK
jgi:cytochrome c6